MKYCCEKMDRAEGDWAFCIYDGEELGAKNEREIYLFGRYGFEDKMKLNFCPFCGRELESLKGRK